MAKLADVNAAIEDLKTTFSTALAKELGEITAQIKVLKDKIAAGGAATEADLDNVVNALSSFKTEAVKAIDNISLTDTADDAPTGGGGTGGA